MLRHQDETRFDDQAQRQIINLAAELQRAEREGATLAELEARARAAGIDPKYVRMAAGHMSPQVTPTLPSTEGPWYRDRELPILAVAGFLITQCFAVYAVMQQRPTPALPFAFLFAFGMGLALSRNAGQRWAALSAVVGSNALLAVLVTFFLRIGLVTPYYYSAGFRRYDELMLFAIAQGIVVLVGCLIAAVARSLRKPRHR